MIKKQDRTHARKAEDLERKYDFNHSLGDAKNQATSAQRTANEALAATEKLGNEIKKIEVNGAVKHEWEGTTLKITTSSGTSSANLKGEKGDKGDTGAQGIQGIQGEKGEKGEKGDKGETGETGATGPQGEQGEKGDTGSQGPTGKSAYQYAKEGGYTGTEAQFKTKLALSYSYGTSDLSAGSSTLATGNQYFVYE